MNMKRVCLEARELAVEHLVYRPTIGVLSPYFALIDWTSDRIKANRIKADIETQPPFYTYIESIREQFEGSIKRDSIIEVLEWREENLETKFLEAKTQNAN